MAAIVLDSFALLAFLRAEDDGGIVRTLLERASDKGNRLHMTQVNYAEVKYILLRKEGKRRWDQIASGLDLLPIEFHAITRPLADLAADFKAQYPISLADAFAAGLAKLMRSELVTGDPEFRVLEHELKIRWLTQRR